MENQITNEDNVIDQQIENVEIFTEVAPEETNDVPEDAEGVTNTQEIEAASEVIEEEEVAEAQETEAAPEVIGEEVAEAQETEAAPKVIGEEEVAEAQETEAASEVIEEVAEAQETEAAPEVIGEEEVAEAQEIEAAPEVIGEEVVEAQETEAAPEVIGEEVTEAHETEAVTEFIEEEVVEVQEIEAAPEVIGEEVADVQETEAAPEVIGEVTETQETKSALEKLMSEEKITIHGMRISSPFNEQIALSSKNLLPANENGDLPTEHCGIVIDNGSGQIKAGFSGEDSPRSVFPTIIGRPRYQAVMVGIQENDAYIGHEAQQRRCILSLSSPIQQGIVINWDDMERIWQHTLLNELRVQPEEHPILLTETPLNPKANRQHMANILFESLNVPAMYVALQAVLALYAGGRRTGLVLDMGNGVSQVMPVYEGYAIQAGAQRRVLAGDVLTRRLVDLLKGRGYSFTSTAEIDIVRNIKEKLCFVAKDVDEAESLLVKEKEVHNADYQLPDGTSITVGAERFRCPEALFRPNLLGLDINGVQHAVYDAIMQCDVDLRSTLFNNTILAGGCTLLPGLPERMHHELQMLAPANTQVRISAPEDRMYSAWLGGSILSSLNSFSEMWISRAEYNECGENIVHRKCF